MYQAEVTKANQFLMDLQTTFDVFVEQIKQYLQSEDGRVAVMKQYKDDQAKLKMNLDLLLQGIAGCCRYVLVIKSQSLMDQLKEIVQKANRVYAQFSQLDFWF